MFLRMTIILFTTSVAGGKQDRNWLTGINQASKVNWLVWLCINPAFMFGSNPAQSSGWWD